MGTVNQAFYDRVRYSLQHSSFGTKIINDPDGWNDDEKEYARNENYHGIFASFSNSLKFVGMGMKTINQIRDTYGIQTNLRLKKEVRHPHTDQWIKDYDGYLDLSTWNELTDNTNSTYVTVKFNSGGIQETLKTRETEDLEITRLTTMDGDTIEQIVPKIVQFDGRRIFLQSSLKNTDADNSVVLEIFSNGNTRSLTGGIPLKILTKSHEELEFVPAQSLGNDDNGTTNEMFFLISQIDRVLDINIQNLSFRTNVTQDDNINFGYYQVNLATYQNGSSFDVKNRIILYQSVNNFMADLGGNAYDNPATTTVIENQPKTHLVNWSGQINLLAGESIALEVLIHADMGDNTSRGHFHVTTDNILVDIISIDEDSHFDRTQSKFFLPYEVAERLILIMSGKRNIFKSNFLGRTDIGYSTDGPGSLSGLTHGFWVRGFDELPASTDTYNNLFKPFTSSWKNFFDSFEAVWNIGLGIEKNGYEEKVVIEDLKYFYNQNVTIKLPNPINNVSRTISTKDYFSSIELGYEKGGSYDEATGLDEYNGKTTFNTLIKVLKQVFSKVSNYRADSYGKEFCRRKPFITYATTDTSYDNDIFIMDLKRGTDDIFKERKWQDDFSKVPTGTYSPDTATNLRFSPFNMLLRHGWQIMAGLTKYPTDFIRYGSSTANSQLKTKLIGGNEYAENGNIQNSQLQKARYEAELIEFEHEVDINISQQIEGYTIINGKKVYNFYGLIEFLNKKKEIERGWLMSLKPNAPGKWQVIKFNKK